MFRFAARKFSTVPVMKKQVGQVNNFPMLFSPLDLGSGVVLKNRIIMGSMHTGLEEPPFMGGLEEVPNLTYLTTQ
jgi:hypothetical protein